MKDQREQRVTEITDMADNHYGRTNDASACFGVVQPPSLPPCSGCKIVSVRTKIRLWLILDKHFIAKPARTTSLPRFLSDTIYEMGTRLMRFQSPHLSASRTRLLFCCGFLRRHFHEKQDRDSHTYIYMYINRERA